MHLGSRVDTQLAYARLADRRIDGEEAATLRRQEFYISHDELLLVSSSRPVSRKDQQREGKERQ
jgi:3-deoxy-D-arabino-heptulosonate 7-phosphate (DAHP) synthase class II